MPKSLNHHQIANSHEPSNQQTQELGFDPKHAEGKLQLEVDSARHNPELNKEHVHDEKNSAESATDLTQKNDSSCSYSWKTIFINALIFMLLAVIGTGCIFTFGQNIKLTNEMQVLKATIQIMEQRQNQKPQAVTATAPITDMTPVPKWLYFDAPKQLSSFWYENLRENILKFEEIIPKSIKTKQVKFILLMANCGVTVWNDYWVKIKTISSKGEDYHFTWGILSPFGSCTWNSELVTLDIEETRQLRIQGSLVLKNADLRFYFVGYSYEP